ncbi:MAG: hypothetical protein ACOYEA_07730, partial [Fermentimonas sp.]
SGLKPNYINLVLACLISKLIIYMKLLQRSLLAVYLNQRLSSFLSMCAFNQKAGAKIWSYTITSKHSCNYFYQDFEEKAKQLNILCENQ